MNFKKHYKTPVRIKQMLKQKKKDLFLVGSYSVFCCVLERNKGGFTSARGGRTSVLGGRTSDPGEVEPPFWEVEPPPWKVVNFDKKS